MNRPSLRVAAVLAAACAACTGGAGSSSSQLSQPSAIIVTASKENVLANGTSSVTIHFEGAAKAPVTVTTQHGVFGFSTSMQVDATSGDALLVTCDAATDATCSGSNTIIVTDAALNTGRTTVKFLGLDACTSSCTFDAACANHTCTTSAGAQGTCSATTPSACLAAAPGVCTATETPKETTCSDGLDNDCNGSIDCADAACDGQPCKAGSPSWSCKSGACADAATGYALQISPARTRLPANGTATTAVTVTVLSGSSPASGVDLSFSTDAGTLLTAAGAPLTSSVPTGSDGTALVQFKASSAPGTATITATVVAMPSVALSAKITMPALGFLAFGGKTFDVMGVKTSGYNETNPISVQVLDDQGRPYPDGLDVRFEHVQLAGSTFSPPLAADSSTCLAAQGCVAYVGTTASPADKPDSTGLALVVLRPGTAAGTLVVSASATVAGQTRSFTLPGVPVIGAKASGSNFSIVCSPRNVPALAETNCSTSNVDTHFTCVAILKDRFGNLLGTATPVMFHSEASAIGPQAAITPAFDPKKDATSQATLGSALQIFETLGAGLPRDVDPFLDEPSMVWDYDPCDSNPYNPTRTHNPRDGVVTVIAIADGEQGFVDLNGNGVYDAGEPFIDQGEPFIDANDNGVWDDGEWFLDVNGNGKYDGSSLTTWKANTKIWTQTVVVYTGEPTTMPDLKAPGKWFGTRWAAAIGFPGACTSTSPASFTVSPGTPAGTSNYFSVVASDGNFNRLASGLPSDKTISTTYGVLVQPPATVTATYYGLTSYADDYGFRFRYWPCDKAGACANQCSATGANTPCVMQPSISGYECGITAGVVVTGGTQADPGTDRVEWDVNLSYSLYPNPSAGRTVLDRQILTGTSK